MIAVSGLCLAVGAVAALMIRRTWLAVSMAAVAAVLGGLTLVAASIPSAAGLELGLVVGAGPRLALLAAYAAGAMAVAAASAGARRALAAAVLLGGGLLTVFVALPLPLALGWLVGLAALQAGLPALAPALDRLRAPVFGIAMVTIGVWLAVAGGAMLTQRGGGVLIAVGLVALAGVHPFSRPLDLGEPAPASAIAWTGWLGPVVVVALYARIDVTIPPVAGLTMSAVLLALGLFNIAAGALGGWLAAEDGDAWLHGFAADWGLAFAGLGLLGVRGTGAAGLILISILILRLPMFLVARHTLLQPGVPVITGRWPRPVNVIVAGALAGVAPFVGFPARLLLLGSAFTLAWPMLVVMALALLTWLPTSARLARSLGAPVRPRGALVGAILALNLVAGVLPILLLRGLG